jgi:hypothetical protein
MRARRGQAVVELAIGAVVFVVVLLVGIHLAEVAALSLKVQEAQAFAVWQATQPRVERRNPATGESELSPFNDTLNTSSGVGPRAKRRYQDFNGLDSVTNGPEIKQALTRGSGVDVDCARDNRLHFQPRGTVNVIYRDEGALHCTAEAQLEAIRIPRSFMQAGEGGWFRAEPFRTQPIPVCGMGLASGGRCTGELAILTNDWGLAGKDETKEDCRFGNCPQPTYKAMTQRMWGGGGGAGAAFATKFAGSAPVSAADFHFSYAGIENGYFQAGADEGGNAGFKTGGPAIGDGMVPWTQTAAPCFLGRPGCQ